MYAQAKPSPLCGFVNSVEHSHMHLLMYYLWLCVLQRSWTVSKEAVIWYTKTKICTIFTLEKKFANPYYNNSSCELPSTYSNAIYIYFIYMI